MTITSAKCDACQKSLYIRNEKEYGPEYGSLIPHFGYTSKFDLVLHRYELVICENCWEKSLRSIGLDPNKYVG